MKRLHFTNFDLAGFTYWEGAIIFDKLTIGTQLRLDREPDNKYDAKAVAVYYKGHKLGYVPRSNNSEISKLCDQGYADIFDTRINRISPSEHAESQLGIVVHIKSKE